MTSERINANDYDNVRLIGAVLTLYYVQELTQAEVARRLGLSTTKVNRLLQQARRQGMVEVIIHAPFQHLFDLEARLKAIFDISDAVVIPQIGENLTAMVHTLGRAGANCLVERLRDGDVIGIGGGTAVHAVVQAINPPRPYDVEVVPVLGAVQGRVTTDVNYLAAQLAERLGGKAYQLHAPAFVDTHEQREVLLAMGPVREILHIARQATVALLGVGAVDYEASRLVQFTALSAEDMKRIAEDYGGVGENAINPWRQESGMFRSGNEQNDVTATNGADVEASLSLAAVDSGRLLEELPREKLAWMLQKMCEVRYFEEKAEELYIRGLVHGTMHLSIGQEASAVGSASALRPDDLIIHHHRGHGHTIAKGADITLMMAEFLGKEPGYCRGRGGSMHIADIPGGNLGATGVVGSGIPTAVGIALALQMHRSDQVLLCFFGDGASNLGEFHESLNMASIWKLPVVFICENNQYGMSMSVRRSMNIEHISTRAVSYGIPGETVDGNDVLAVYQTVQAAVEYARSGKGPVLVENVTYRWRGHSKSDRNLYRTQEEIESWKQRCPIMRFKQMLVEAGVMDSEEVETIDQEAKATVDRAAEEALTFPEPSPENMEDEVYAP